MTRHGQRKLLVREVLWTVACDGAYSAVLVNDDHRGIPSVLVGRGGSSPPVSASAGGGAGVDQASRNLRALGEQIDACDSCRFTALDRYLKFGC